MTSLYYNNDIKIQIQKPASAIANKSLPIDTTTATNAAKNSSKSRSTFFAIHQLLYIRRGTFIYQYFSMTLESPFV